MKETIIIGGRTNKTTTTLKEILEKKEKEEFAIAELEKIKNKIAINDNSVWVFAGRKFIEKEEILNIIDGEVSKLKGENKE